MFESGIIHRRPTFQRKKPAELFSTWYRGVFQKTRQEPGCFSFSLYTTTNQQIMESCGTQCQETFDLLVLSQIIESICRPQNVMVYRYGQKNNAVPKAVIFGQQSIDFARVESIEYAAYYIAHMYLHVLDCVQAIIKCKYISTYNSRYFLTSLHDQHFHLCQLLHCCPPMDLSVACLGSSRSCPKGKGPQTNS